MGDEWFRETRDESSVLKDFIKLMEVEPENKQEVEKVLVPIFLRRFVNGYKAIKKFCAEAKDKPKEMMDLDIWVSQAAGSIPSANSRLEPKDKAHYLGNALGLGLGFVEFGIVSETYKQVAENPSNTKRVLGYYTQIKDKMREINKSVRQKFIARRLEKINKKNAGKLSKEQQILITKIAVIFLSD